MSYGIISKRYFKADKQDVAKVCAPVAQGIEQ